MARTAFRGLAAVLVCFGTSYLAKAQDTISGSVDLLTEANASADHSVNVGGLVIVEIEDSGSRPPADISVTFSRTFEKLGEVTGVHYDKHGKPLMGGGYTWWLLKPVNEGKEPITLKYTPNEAGADPIVVTFGTEVGNG